MAQSTIAMALKYRVGSMKFLCFLLAVTQSLSALAHPVSFKDAVSVMSWNQSFMSDNWLTYSLNHKVALAARHMRMDTLMGRENYTAPQIDFLLKRWNEMNSQANIYIYGSYGSLHRLNKSEGAGLAGVEIDAESRKHFVLVKYEKLWSETGPGMERWEARLGVAPYEAEFNEWASWFMIQYQRHPLMIRKELVTPMVRLFYRSVMLETGVSFEGDWMTNLMFHF